MYKSTKINMPQNGRQSSLLRIPWGSVCAWTIFLPGFGFFFAILWSLLFNFKASINTHCRVFNFLPSISAAIDYSPPEYIWRICVTCHAVPRFVILVGYTELNKRRKMLQGNRLSQYQGILAKLAGFANAVELIGLVLLTNISSQDNKAVHVMSFTAFISFSVLYMGTMCLLYSSMVNENEFHQKSLKRKKLYCSINISSIVFALYFYYRHNTYCEPGVYSLFALAEYIVVLSNMAFHYTARYDFIGYDLRLAPANDVKGF